MNTFGTLFRLTTAGESHGPALVGIVDGMPPGIRVDFDRIALEMSRRRPGQDYATSRCEADEVRFLSGILNGVTLGTPIAFVIENTDAHSEDYDAISKTIRPSHADFTYQAKYGIRDPRGGGRTSARETALRVVAGALAMQVLERRSIYVEAYTSRIGSVAVNENDPIDISKIWDSPVRCPVKTVSEKMEEELRIVRKQGDTVGCEVSGMVTGLVPGVGEPIYDKLSARLAYAMMSINAAHSFGYGDAEAMSASRGSEMADKFIVRDDGTVGTSTNHSGGIQGGISNGMPVTFKVCFKPLPTLMVPMESINERGETVIIEPRGRHDVCAVPRAVPVVRAMAAMVILDLCLRDYRFLQ